MITIIFFIKNVFQGYSIKEIKETTLGGNFIKANLNRLKWKSTDDKHIDANFEYHASPMTSLNCIKLMPMEIHTFIIRLFVK